MGRQGLLKFVPTGLLRPAAGRGHRARPVATFSSHCIASARFTSGADLAKTDRAFVLPGHVARHAQLLYLRIIRICTFRPSLLMSRWKWLVGGNPVKNSMVRKSRILARLCNSRANSILRLWKLLPALCLLTASPIAASADSTEPAVKPLPPGLADTPFGRDVTAAREWLTTHGISVGFIYTNDVLANLHGGNRRGVIDQGKLEAILTVDLEKLARLPGLSFYANAFQIHNTGRIRRDYVGGINTIAAIEAVPTTRLSELWLEQKFWDGKASLRAGQLAADVEFFFAGLSDLFLQSDWPTITARNLPSGGPAYPLSTPGVRWKFEPNDSVSMLAAIFNGDPAGPGPGDPEIRNRHGLNFRVNDPALLIAEGQFRTNQRDDDTGLARTLKVGGWAHLGSFDDQRFDQNGMLLADPASSGLPAKRHKNFGIYGVVEQQLYRPAGGNATSGISVFSRISASPSDRNPIDFYIDAGIVAANMIASRPDDKFGASFIYARFSDGVRAFDRDRIAITGIPGVVRDYEANLELTYLAQINRNWTAQPVLTYIWHPSGDSSRNALVAGARSIWRF